MRRKLLAAVGLAAPLFLHGQTAAEAGKSGFVLAGEKWSYRGDDVSVTGILLKPEGDGPFPAIVISHGAGGNAGGFALTKAREMVKWGFVCIGTNYTFAGRPGVPRAPRPAGGPDPFDRSENLKRAARCVAILESLPYVDRKRICAYGNSAGAALTVAMAGNMPGKIVAAAITAGGIGGRFTGPEIAEKIRCPFLMIHGAADPLVSPESSLALQQALDHNRVENKRVVFDGIGHNVHGDKRDEVYALLREWFAQHGVLR
ncbi:MAG: dienelactone hydrolase family protein [Acidobacteria bacterium]|nr:dienelactone hydrolase family protein [Acidobacteriota bacterium]